MNSLPQVSLFFPVYNDQHTIRDLALSAREMLKRCASKFEIIIIDDGSPDRSGELADQLVIEYPSEITVIHHHKNLGYGASLKSGIAASQFEWICMIDGDNEYDVLDLEKMLDLRQFYLLVIAFRYKKLYSTKRIFISFVYNMLLRFLFRTEFRDISTGIRLINRTILRDITVTSDSPFVGAELAIKANLRGYPVGELGIQTFPRTFGTGSAVTFLNIKKTIQDMMRVRREIFSDRYQLPLHRARNR
jgi:glycosyltransferase involved in cell wall biosynthesis